ncbi:hypothetical protein FDECE_6946 [Fusarium decemcellulare]|nr:hypothetical protein FDECE_6946 [Fusarium decemcellulare]
MESASLAEPQPAKTRLLPAASPLLYKNLGRYSKGISGYVSEVDTNHAMMCGERLDYEETGPSLSGPMQYGHYKHSQNLEF